jgi:hypothetical protein
MIPIPAFIDSDAWAGFCEMRRSKGKSRPFTTRAATMILTELYKLRDAGYDPNACLDQSTLHAWDDVYALKDKLIPRASTQAAPNKVLEVMQAEKQALQDPEIKARADAARREAMSKVRPIRGVA